MSLCFACFVPLSIFVARACRHAPRISFLHGTLGTLTAELILAAAMSALYSVSYTPDMSLHRTLGIVTAALVIASLFFAILFKSIRGCSGLEAKWWLRVRSLHGLAGWGVMGLGWTNAGLGIQFLFPEYMVAFYAVIACIGTLLLVADIYTKVKRGECTWRQIRVKSKSRRQSLVPLVSHLRLSISSPSPTLPPSDSLQPGDAATEGAGETPSIAERRRRTSSARRLSLVEWFTPRTSRGGQPEALPSWTRASVLSRNAVHRTLCFSFAEGYVVDLTSYASHHPGGSALIYEYAGEDITRFFLRSDSFDEVLHVHSRQGLNLLRTLRVAVLVEETSVASPNEDARVRADAGLPVESAGVVPSVSADAVVSSRSEAVFESAPSGVDSIHAAALAAHVLRCVEVVNEDDDSTVKTFVFQAPSGFRYLPGQHGVFVLSSNGDTDDTPGRGTPRGLKRTWTLSAHPSVADGRVVISVRCAAHASRILHDTMRPGGTIRLLGVAGTFTPELARSAHRPILLLAGGIGITAMRAMIPTFVAAHRQVALVYSVRTLATAAFVPELSALAGCSVTITATGEPPDSTWAGRRGRIDTTLVRMSVPGGAARECYIFICGPRLFEESCRTILETLGALPTRIFSESFAPSTKS
jgi:ferredoxin-NADP reductase/cytochrome b involved in lipid metabolism